jgi:hypothetical protein
MSDLHNAATIPHNHPPNITPPFVGIMHFNCSTELLPLLKHCMYIWTNSTHEFWFFLNDVRDHELFGFVWNGNSWRKSEGIPFNNILSIL